MSDKQEIMFRNHGEFIPAEGVYCAEDTRTRIEGELRKSGAKIPASHADFHRALLSTIRNFRYIILRGAGHLGQHMLDYLLSEDVAKEKFRFWDKEANHIRDVSGIPVLPPFSGDSPPRDTLILHCISSLFPYDAENYTERGYREHMDGLAFLCPYNLGSGKQMLVCAPNPRCALIRCPRQMKQGFLYTPHKPNAGASPSTLISDKINLNINTRCTLQCRHCIKYTNSLSAEKRLDFPLERILYDIKCICTAHDFIRIGALEGGEPLLHRNFPQILSYFLAQPNVGMISINSNCICRISRENMIAMQNERVLLRISSYAGSLDKKQEDLLAKNMNQLAEHGIAHILYQVIWNPSPTLLKRKCSASVLQRIKTSCPYFLECRAVFKGIYFPCHFACMIAWHDIADYPEDRVLLSEGISHETLRKRIIALNEQPYYQSCTHCDFSKEQVPAGEQGVDARYAHIGKRSSFLTLK